MPKATTEGGGTNAWEPPLTCDECGAKVAAGAPRCPECPSVKFTGPEAETVPDAPEAETEPETGEDEAGEAEALAEAQAPDAAPEPAPELPVPPRTPPRRT